jgi:choline dehydrogenase-like flavoprotein
MRAEEWGFQPPSSVLRPSLYKKLYACDLSVFPASPAANPTLTLAALAIRLADHLKAKV